MSQDNQLKTRREFFQTAAALVGTSVLIPILAKAEGRRGGGSPAAGSAAGGALKLVDPNDPQAKAVNYVINNSSIKDKSLQTERNGVKFKEQKCSGCTFYSADKEATVEGKKAAPCQLPFAGGKAVVAAGWCTTWAKRGG